MLVMKIEDGFESTFRPLKVGKTYTCLERYNEEGVTMVISFKKASFKNLALPSTNNFVILEYVNGVGGSVVNRAFNV
jgi:hypothetical protein